MSPDVEALLGLPARSFGEFAADHRAASRDVAGRGGADPLAQERQHGPADRSGASANGQWPLSGQDRDVAREGTPRAGARRSCDRQVRVVLAPDHQRRDVARRHQRRERRPPRAGSSVAR